MGTAMHKTDEAPIFMKFIFSWEKGDDKQIQKIMEVVGAEKVFFK